MGVEGKYIYASSARYNYNKELNMIDPIIAVAYGDINIIKLMDLYTQVKYVIRKEESKDDLLKYSSRAQSEEDSKGDTWYNLRFPN